MEYLKGEEEEKIIKYILGVWDFECAVMRQTTHNNNILFSFCFVTFQSIEYAILFENKPNASGWNLISWNVVNSPQGRGRAHHLILGEKIKNVWGHKRNT